MKKLAVVALILGIFLAVPLFAAPEAGGAQNGTQNGGSQVIYLWAIVVGGAALTLAAAVGAIAQSKAIVAVAESISRNPAASGVLRTTLILGLAFIESLVIYVLLIDLIIFFVKWGTW